MSARVYAYGAGSPVSGIEHAIAESARNGRFWDRLVALQEEHEISLLAAASATTPRLVELRDLIYSTGQDLAAVFDERAAQRKAARRKTETPTLDARIQDLDQQRRLWRSEFWRLLSAWRQAHPDDVRELTDAHFERRKEARNNSGLYWGNYNRVLASFDAALKLCRKTGRSLRRRDPLRTDGCLMVQIQRTATGLGADPAEIMAGALSDVRLPPHTERQRMLEFRVDAGGNCLRIPVWYHRPLPPRSRVKSVQLTWCDGGARGRQWRVHFTCVDDAQPPVHFSDIVAGVDTGWRVMARDGRLRVAVCKMSDGSATELALDAKWMAQMDRVEDLASQLDSSNGLDEHGRRRLQLEQRGLRTKLLRRRRELYRVFAAQLTERAGRIGIENLDLAGLAMRGERELPPATRAHRQRAALSELLREIFTAASKRGSEVVELAGPSTRVCSNCGNRNSVGEDLFFTCDGCGKLWDQDENAAANLMAAAHAASSPVAAEPEGKEDNGLRVDTRPRYGAGRKSTSARPRAKELL